MQYVFESLEEFLFEDLGSLKKFNLPKNLLDRILKQANYFGVGGRESAVDLIDNPKDYQKLLKALKDPFVAGIISVDGDPRVFFHRSSERKFQCYSILRSREEEEDKRKKDAERKQREIERERQRQNEGLNEARRGYHRYDPTDMGEMSTQALAYFIKGLEGDVTVELIRPDINRDTKKKERFETRRGEDPLAQDHQGYIASPSQRKRYEKFATKKRIEIDKKVDEQREKLKKQIEENFDKAFNKIMEDLRKGYAWYADPKHFSDELLKGVDFSGIKTLASAYDAVEPGQSDPNSVSKAISVLKKLGYNK